MRKSAQLHVGFDVSVLRHGLTSGSAVYTYNLAVALLRLPDPPELSLYYGTRPSGRATELLEDLSSCGASVVYGPAPWNWSPDGAWWLPWKPKMGKILESVDVFHLGELVAPRVRSCPIVATVHDLTTELYPETHTWLNRKLHQGRLSWISKHADRVLVDSESTADDLARRSPELRGRIDCVPLARGGPMDGGMEEHDLDAVRSKHRIGSDPFVLTVGTLEPRKNHRRLISAFERLPADLAEHVKLVIVGGRGWRDTELRRSIETSRYRDRILALGFVPAEDLAALYRAAHAFAYPTLYEGFGLPLLEAMAAGTPVLTSAVSSMPEVVGDAAVLVDPASVESIRDGLSALISNAELCRELSGRGKVRERAFTWERTAAQTMEVYRTAIEQSTGTRQLAAGG